MMFRPLRAAILLLTAALAVSACAPTARNTALSLAQERQTSARALGQLEAKGLIIHDRRLNRYLNGVVNRIAAGRPPGAAPVRAYIVKNADVNAFTTGGGYLFFNAGMLAAMENEAQLATVAAHEIAHIDRGHVQASRSNRQAVRIGAVLASIGAAAVGINPNVANLGLNLGASYAANSFSRTQETDADNIGIRYLARAGYNGVEGAKSFAVLQRVHGRRGGPAATFFASHPASGDRQASLTAQARAMGATRGRVGTRSHDRATRRIRREVLRFYDSKGRRREAAQIRKNLR